METALKKAGKSCSEIIGTENVSQTVREDSQYSERRVGRLWSLVHISNGRSTVASACLNTMKDAIQWPIAISTRIGMVESEGRGRSRVTEYCPGAATLRQHGLLTSSRDHDSLRSNRVKREAEERRRGALGLVDEIHMDDALTSSEVPGYRTLNREAEERILVD